MSHEFDGRIEGLVVEHVLALRVLIDDKVTTLQGCVVVVYSTIQSMSNDYVMVGHSR